MKQLRKLKGTKTGSYFFYKGGQYFSLSHLMNWIKYTCLLRHSELGHCIRGILDSLDDNEKVATF